jgi:hypothetical protein
MRGDTAALRTIYRGAQPTTQPEPWVGLLCEEILPGGRGVIYRDLATWEWVPEYDGRRLARVPWWLGIGMARDQIDIEARSVRYAA